MSIQGSGGGPKPGLPPKATTTGADGARESGSTSSPPKTAAETQAPAAPTRPGHHRDGFETGTSVDPRFASERAALMSSEAATISGIESMARILEETRTQILDEHRALRKKLQSVVKKLAEAHFDHAVIEAHGAELTALRSRLAALRRRLQHIQRRLKSIMQKARHADADVGKAIAGQLSRLEKLEPGLERALAALSAVEGAVHGEGSTLAIDPDDGQSAADRGDRLARAVPGAAVAQGLTHLLSTSTPEHPLISADDFGDDDTQTTRPLTSDDAVARLERLADTLLKSL